nr:hypothetical protein [Azospirillum brasilense]
MVTLSAVEAADVPLAVLALTVSECAPSLSDADVTVHRPAPSAVAVPTVVAPSYSTTVAKASAVPVIVGVVTLVSVSVVEPLFDPAVSARPLGAAGGGGPLRNSTVSPSVLPIRASRSPSPSMSTKIGVALSPTSPRPKGLVPSRTKVGAAAVPTLR